jgi:predicted aldo/keto reductase-like oxidoreductase
MNQVGSDCQDNLVAILKQAIDYGMIHIETARGYGCSELQLGVALRQLMLTGHVQREDLIIQTKIPANEDPLAFREALDLSLKNLQVEYVDLFAFHGMNFDEQFEWVFGREGNNCLSVVKEYMAAGKIRHLGFSTHGSTDFIIKCINMDVFDYVNLHYHYFGSYTASGGGQDGLGNLDAVKLLGQKDIGCFIISPFDKGGRLYAPSRKLCSLTLPEMEPMTFKSLWLWNHHRIYQGLPQLHTFTVGAARPSDLDQPAVAAYCHATNPDEVLAKITAVTRRLDDTKVKTLGQEWVATWWRGLPKSTGSKYQVEHNQIVWIYNSIFAFGLFEFGKARYHSFENNEAKWDESLSPEDNIAKNIGKNAWGFVPGRPLKVDTDYSEDLANVPKENKQRVMEAEGFVYQWCHAEEERPKTVESGVGNGPIKRTKSFFRRTFSVSAQIFRLPSNFETEIKEDEEPEAFPKEWETAYDLRPWPDYPDQPSRA